jgi:hypothetical protein
MQRMDSTPEIIQKPLWTRICESIHLLALGLWAGVLLMVGATAAVTFPKLAELDVRVPGFEGYDAEHHRIAAGQVMNLAFAVADWIGMACLVVAVVTILILTVPRGVWRHRIGPALVLRVAALAFVLVLTLFQTFAFRPSLNRSFERLWTAAEVGDNQQATEIRDRLAPQHAKASFLLTSQLGLVLIAGIAGGIDATDRRSGWNAVEHSV